MKTNKKSLDTKRNIKNVDPYIIVFIIFLISAGLMAISPLLVKCWFFNSLLKWVLAPLSNHKGEYINLLGGIVGTGLAVSSALWMQRIAQKKEDDAQKQELSQKRSLAGKILASYIERELKRLWGLWIWTTYDTSAYFDDDYKVLYEPYNIKTNGVFESIIVFESLLEEDSKVLFYDLFDFTEIINDYISNYNKLNYDVLNINSNSCGTEAVSICTDYNKNSFCISILKTISRLIDSKKMLLFFDDDFDVNSWEVYYSQRSMSLRIINKLEDEIKKDMTKSNNKGDNDSNYYKSMAILDQWVNSDDCIGIDEKYITQVKKIRAMLQDLTELKLKYESDRSRYCHLLDKPYHSDKIEKLIGALTGI